MGHHSVSGVHQLHVRRRRRSSQSTDHVHAENSAQDSFLHGQPHHSVRSNLVLERLRLLFASRRRRKDDHVHIDSARSGRFSAASLQDPTADLHYHSSHSQLQRRQQQR